MNLVAAGDIAGREWAACALMAGGQESQDGCAVGGVFRYAVKDLRQSLDFVVRAEARQGFHSRHVLDSGPNGGLSPLPCSTSIRLHPLAQVNRHRGRPWTLAHRHGPCNTNCN